MMHRAAQGAEQGITGRPVWSATTKARELLRRRGVHRQRRRALLETQPAIVLPNASLTAVRLCRVDAS